MEEQEENPGNWSQVAEAALLALGPSLEWSRGNRSNRIGRSVAQGFRLVYMLVPGRDGQGWRIGYKRPDARWLWLKSNGQWEPHSTVAPGCTWYASPAAAKAACERHFAAEKWD